MKQTAAVSALFILVNSLAGLAGLFAKGFDFRLEMVWMIVVVFIGGLAGSYLGAMKFGGSFLKKVLVVVLLMTSVKLLFA